MDMDNDSDLTLGEKAGCAGGCLIALLYLVWRVAWFLAMIALPFVILGFLFF